MQQIKELIPAVLDDKFAKKLGLDSADAIKEVLEKSLTATKDSQRRDAFKKQIEEALIEKNSFDVPESLVDTTIDQMIERMNSQFGGKGFKIDPKNEEFRSKFRDSAIKEVKSVLLLGNIGRIEKITVEENELKDELQTFALQNQMSPQEVVKQGGWQIVEELRGRVLIRKVIDFVASQGQVTFKEGVAGSEEAPQ